MFLSHLIDVEKKEVKSAFSVTIGLFQAATNENKTFCRKSANLLFYFHIVNGFSAFLT